MDTNDKRNKADQEIDLSMISDKLGNFVQSINTQIFKLIQFGLKHSIVLGTLFVLGVGIGVFLDKSTKVYDNQIIVAPNFGSYDYLYSKIDLIESKIKDQDTMFLKGIGIVHPDRLKKIEVAPIIDIYQFVSNGSEKNFELLKLMAEDGDMKKIVEENMTSKNYNYHLISFVTNKKLANKEIMDPLLKYLNQDTFYSTVQKVQIQNINTKMRANEVIIAQIDGFLNGFSDITKANTKSDKLVYYNENTQLNDVIQTKNNLTAELGKLRLDLVSLDKIIKNISSTTNIKNTKTINGKLKLILPFVFIALYLLGFAFINFYKTQAAKHKAQ